MVSFKDTGIANLSSTYRGPVLIEDGTIQQAVAKDIPQRELANEVLAAALATELGLEVPRAFLAVAEAGVLATTSAPRLTDGSSLVFVSLDVQSPSVAQIVLRDPDPAVQTRAAATIAKAIAVTDEGGAIYGFDAWSANIDRHTGNLLFRGATGCWLIDHGRCFTGENWKPSDFVPDAPYRHRLHEWLTPFLSDSDKDKMVGECAALAARLSAMDVGAIAAADDLVELLGRPDFDAVVEFLSNRIQHVPRLGAIALDRIV